MIEQICTELLAKENIRQNLIEAKKIIKADNERFMMQRFHQQHPFLVEFLKEEDPKIRKNTAILIGELRIQEAAGDLYEAYMAEDKLFVKSSYLSAMNQLDCTAYSKELHERYEVLLAMKPEENEKKHIAEETRELDKLLRSMDGEKKHVYTGYQQENEIILTTNPAYRELTAEQITEGRPLLIPGGVKVVTTNLREVLEIRTYRELLFTLDCSRHIEMNPAAIAQELVASKLMQFLAEAHDGGDTFYFRIDIKGRMALDERSAFIRKLSAQIEEKSAHKLMNSADNYEIELRLMINKDSTVCPFVKLYTLPDNRFDYRKNVVASSIQPSAAALLMRLAMPYLEEGAQILDPFCGVGTMLIERSRLVDAGDMYATDIYGEAIESGRENAQNAGVRINFINRDFFDFTHKYLFDEIVTNMPVRGRKTKEEQDELYGHFFDKASELMNRKGVIVMYTNEYGFVKKQLRLHKNYRLQKEFCIREKDGFYLFIIGIKG